MIKHNIKTTYKNIPTDMNAQEDYLDYAGRGEKKYTDNELKWFRAFHNKSNNDILSTQQWEWETYAKMMSYLAFGKEFDLEFNCTTKGSKLQGVYVHYRASRTGIKIELNPLAITEFGSGGRESVHQLATSVIRHELCHWYLHVTGSKEYSDGQREFETLLYKVDSDSTRTASVEESKKVQQAHMNGTYKRDTLHYDVTIKKVLLEKTKIDESIFKIAYEVKNAKTSEHIAYIAKAKNGLFIPISEEYAKSYANKHGDNNYSKIRDAKMGFRQRNMALMSLMQTIGRDC